MAAAVAITAGVAAATIAARAARIAATTRRSGCIAAAFACRSRSVTAAAIGAARAGCGRWRLRGSSRGSRSGWRCRCCLLRGIVVVIIAVLVRRGRERVRRCFGKGHSGRESAGHGDHNRQSCAIHVLDSNPLKNAGGAGVSPSRLTCW